MQNPDRIQDQPQLGAGVVERLAAAQAHRKMTEDRKGAAERDYTKFRALNEVLVLCEQSLLQHRSQIAAGDPPPSVFIVEGLDAAIEELRRLQKQTQDLSLKNEGALNALTSLEETFKQAAAQTVAQLRELSTGAPRPAAPSETEEAAPAVESEPDGMSLLDAFEGSEDAKEPIAEPRRGASRKSSK